LKFTYLSEEYVASIFRVEAQLKHETKVKDISNRTLLARLRNTPVFPEYKIPESSVCFAGHVITPATDVGVWATLEGWQTGVSPRDSLANTEDPPALDTGDVFWNANSL
jgi:hypothetical protein